MAKRIKEGCVRNESTCILHIFHYVQSNIKNSQYQVEHRHWKVKSMLTHCCITSTKWSVNSAGDTISECGLVLEVWHVISHIPMVMVFTWFKIANVKNLLVLNVPVPALSWSGCTELMHRNTLVFCGWLTVSCGINLLSSGSNRVLGSQNLQLCYL